jgi:hypothetical protein
MVPSYKSLHGDLTLYYLYRQSSDDGFYYYDSQSERYQPYMVLSVPAQSFTVLSPGNEDIIPEGWTLSSMTIDGKTMPVWKKDGQEDSTTYLVYLMDSRGQQAFFQYDTASQLLIPYVAQEGIQPEPTPTETEADITPIPVVPNPEQPNPWQLATAVLGLACIILTSLLIVQAVRKNGRFNRRHYKNGHLPPPPPIKRI